jgi:hypothetical protein
MHRLDEQLIALDKEYNQNKSDKSILLKIQSRYDAVHCVCVSASLHSPSPHFHFHRERELMTIYSQIATTFADLHDTPGRMKAKDCIRDIIAWAQAREYFYYRVARRMEEEYMKKHLQSAGLSGENNEQLIARIKKFVENDTAAPVSDDRWNDDRWMLKWYQSHVADQNKLIQASLKINEPVDAAMTALLKAIENSKLNATERNTVLARLRVAVNDTAIGTIAPSTATSSSSSVKSDDSKAKTTSTTSNSNNKRQQQTKSRSPNQSNNNRNNQQKKKK